MLDYSQYPKFFDVLCAAIVTLWLVLSACLCLFFIFQDGLTLVEAVASSLFLLFFAGTPVFLFGGIISFPMWWICKRFWKLDQNITAIIGAVTGIIISAFIIFTIPIDFRGTTLGATQSGLLTVLITTFFGLVAGWNGYRVAWNGRRRKKAPKT